MIDADPPPVRLMAEHYKEELTRRLEAATAAFDRCWTEMGSESPAVLRLARRLLLPGPFAERLRGEIEQAVSVLRQRSPPPVPGGSAEDGEARLAAATRLLQLLEFLESTDEPRVLREQSGRSSVSAPGDVDDGTVMWAGHGVWRFPSKSSDGLLAGIIKEPGRGGGASCSGAFSGPRGGPTAGACGGDYGDDGTLAADRTQHEGEASLAERLAAVLGKAGDEELAAALSGQVTDLLERNQKFSSLFEPEAPKAKETGEADEDQDDNWWQPPGFVDVDQPLAPKEEPPPPTPPRTPTPPPTPPPPEPDIVMSMRLHGVSMDDARKTPEARLSEKLAAVVAKECGIPREWVARLAWGPPVVQLPSLGEDSESLDIDEIETIGPSGTGSRNEGAASMPRSSIVAA